MLNNNINYSPKVIQTSSESLFESNRELIEKAFECKIYDWYGQSEYVVSAGQCPEGNYHINVESGIMEFVKDNENVAPGELGEIVGTGFYNYSMPFIRYKLGDVGKSSDEVCACGRALPILESLDGRVNDIITTPDGKIISGLAFHHYWRRRINPYLPNVEDAHVIQKSKSKLLIELVKKEGYSDKETQKILTELKMLLGSGMEIEFKDMDSIQTGNKRRFTESELTLNLL
jgi:phenylacetate-CoA ligase